MRLGLLAYLFIPLGGVSFALMRADLLRIPLDPQVFGRGEATTWMLAAFLSFPFSVVAAMIMQWIGPVSSLGLNRILAQIAIVSTLLMVALSAAGLVRCIGRVEPDNYLLSLPVVGRISGKDPQPFEVQGVQIRMACGKWTCAPEALGGVEARKDAPDNSLHSPLKSDEPVLVLSDGRSSVVVLRSVNGAHRWALDRRTMAFRESLSFFDVSKSLSPPRAWVGFGCLISMLSLALLLLGKWHSRNKGLIGGIADGAGRIVLEDGDAFTVRSGLGATIGPATVRLTGALRRQRGGPYRAATPQQATSTIWAGTIEDAREWLRDEASAHFAWALVLNGYAAIPLLVSAQQGLLY